ncbi:MAG: thioredoxin [Proteobacteria bacterium]|nr:thioredoxin [Pseudomonadota bacterium]
MSEFVKAVNASEFEQEVLLKSQSVPVLIDFWADWCEPCKQLMPLLHKIVDSLNGSVHLVTVDTDAEQELAMSYGVRSLPTVLLMKNGEIIEQFMGVKPESEIRQLLEPHLLPVEESTKDHEKNHASDDMQKAMELINQGQVSEAIPYLQSDSSFDGKLLLIKIYLQEGEINNAIESFANLSSEDKEKDQAKMIKVTLDLIQLGKKNDDLQLQGAIETTISVNPQEGIEQLLQLLSRTKGNDKEPVKQSLIFAFNLIDDAKLVSQLRRKMASLIF